MTQRPEQEFLVEFAHTKQLLYKYLSNNNKYIRDLGLRYHTQKKRGDKNKL